jgi:hypothetical protein
MNRTLLTTTLSSLALPKADARIVHVAHLKATIATTIDGGGRRGDATTTTITIEGGTMNAAHLKPNVTIRGNKAAAFTKADTAMDGRLEANTTTTTTKTKKVVLFLTPTSDIGKGDGDRMRF